MVKLVQKRIVVDGTLVSFYAVDADDQQETSVVFLHGWRADGTIWFPIMNALRGQNFSLYSLDLPGFGKSEKLGVTPTLGDYAHLVWEFIEKLGLRGVTLVGHSFGGNVAVKLATMRPKLVEKLVLVNSSGIRRKSPKKMVFKGIAKLLKPFFASPFMQPMRRKVYRMIGAEDYVSTPELKETFINIINEDITNSLSKVEAETLIIWGGKDGETPPGDGEKMARAIPRAKLEVFPAAGHFSFLDNKDKFIELLNEFII